MTKQDTPLAGVKGIEVGYDHALEYAPPLRGLSAITEIDGGWIHWSKLPGESKWTADAVFGANGYPHWSHGFGAGRTYLRLQVAIPEVAELLDSAVREAGLSLADGLADDAAADQQTGNHPRPRTAPPHERRHQPARPRPAAQPTAGKHRRRHVHVGTST